jgi:hypothetical protein
MLKYYCKVGGPVYGGLYRITMGVSALLHLMLLAAVFRFGNKEIVRLKFAKWKTVWRWSLGLEQPAVDV